MFYFVRDEFQNISKYAPDSQSYNKEIKIYLELLDKNIFANMNANNNIITYMVNDMMSLRSFLDSLSLHERKARCCIILNELFSFVNTLHTYQFVHGNLTIDNIFVEKTQSPSKFYLVDLGYSKTPSTVPSLEFERQYLYDFMSLHISLQTYFDDASELQYLDNIVSMYTKSLNSKS
jgi:tRNA A-37 threonylcarbamoyl transferase component Bud32